jgi:hypothetical protein
VKLAIQPKAAQPATGQGHSAIPGRTVAEK